MKTLQEVLIEIAKNQAERNGVKVAPPRGRWFTKLLTGLIMFALVCACVAVAIGSVALAVAGFRYVFGL